MLVENRCWYICIYYFCQKTLWIPNVLPYKLFSLLYYLSLYMFLFIMYVAIKIYHLSYCSDVHGIQQQHYLGSYDAEKALGSRTADCQAGRKKTHKKVTQKMQTIPFRPCE